MSMNTYDVAYTTTHITTVVADSPEDAAEIVRASDPARTVEIIDIRPV